MNKKDKLSIIGKLSEEELRRKVIIPLLGRMGFKAAIEYHGPREKGKDIICFDYDKLNIKTFLSIVVKTCNLDGSISSNKSLQSILFQIKQCFDEPYEDLYDMSSLTMDQAWIVTSGRIKSGAQESIANSLKKENLSKLVRFIGGEHLIELIDKYYISFWGLEKESPEYVRAQRDRVIDYLKKLIRELGGNSPDINKVIQGLLNSDYTPLVLKSDNIFISQISPFSIKLEGVSQKYNHDFYSSDVGLIKDCFVETKQKLEWSMRDIEEIIENYIATIKEIDPGEFIYLFESKLEGNYPFHGASWGAASDTLSNYYLLQSAVNDISELINNLEEKGKLEWALHLIDSLKVVHNDIEKFISNVENSEFQMHWNIVPDGNNEKIELIYSKNQITDKSFSTNHKKEINTYARWGPKTRKIEVKDIIEEVQRNIRIYIDGVLAQ